ncbi:hypothetical protein QBC32DRAFT_331079 [Pseudoneurospora amorphoporcata]|uniref:Uncharacterized protein n=1 Tax=Pseudoneurospora amorphoporcata TaxID=241081 RepID=A0AAN6P2E0_9PEZI|nr:hypothetical protein QBC32DRAFT_331079 [Pseudoneurospora amorphoporcata]
MACILTTLYARSGMQTWLTWLAGLAYIVSGKGQNNDDDNNNNNNTTNPGSSQPPSLGI